MPQVDDADDARVSLARRRPPLSAGIASDGSPRFPASRQPRVGTPLLREIAAPPFRAAARTIHARERHARRAELAWWTRTPADGASRTTSRVGAGRLSAPRRVRRGLRGCSRDRGPRRRRRRRRSCAFIDARNSPARPTHRATHPRRAAPRRREPQRWARPRAARAAASGRSATPRRKRRRRSAGRRPTRRGPASDPFFRTRARQDPSPAKELPRARARLRDRRRARPS